ncbi:hypothetical protein MBLNU230_g0869t1 [Neophaeotheca triangularis]
MNGPLECRTSDIQEAELAATSPCAKTSPLRKQERPVQSVRFSSQDDVVEFERYHYADADSRSRNDVSRFRATRITSTVPTLTQMPSPIPPQVSSMAYRLWALALILAATMPLLQVSSFFAYGGPVKGVNARVVPDRATRTAGLSKRQDSSTDVCFRWAQQSALVNGTLYLYGGEAMTESGQEQNTWNNNFLTLDLTRTWQISTPALEGLPQPSGPPAVALGYLWNSRDSLYLYGGQFSWQPPRSPTPFSLWEYSIPNEEWIEHSDPTTSEGESAPSGGDDVQRSAEGAGVTVSALGRGFYFGGHLDGYTTDGWSQSIPRIYLQSLLEFTFPGYGNEQVDALSDGQTAGSDGIYRNITEGGLQSESGFTKRADGLLLYVPGFGDQGILLALAGGTNETFTQMNSIDVYDIATSAWYKQSTSGPTPRIRVNPCAVVAAAPDGSSYNVYMFGGQNLRPFREQIQYDDMWILSIPSFTWIEVDQSDQSVPYGRSGHTCNVWDGQMIMVGGHVEEDLSCESPGIYVFDLSSLQWQQRFTARNPGSVESGSGSSGTASASAASASASASSGSGVESNPFNQQPAQLAADSDDHGGLEGSYGYEVPEAVISVIGGNKRGGATVTEPVQTASDGPLATGSPKTYTVTDSAGAVVTQTSSPDSSQDNNASSEDGSNSSTSGSTGPNVGAIIAGVIAGVCFLAACYLAFCTYVYRRQLKLYKRHVEMSQRQARGEKMPAIPGLLGTDSAKNSDDRRRELLGGGYDSDSRDPSTKVASGARSKYSGGQNSGGEKSGSGNNTGYAESARSSTEDLLGGTEPTFVGVMLNPRRSLRVINRD